MNLKTNLKVVDEDECFDALFSEDLYFAAHYIMKYFPDVKSRIDEDDNLTLIYAFIDYLECHDFENLEISVDSGDHVPFPYLPTLLLADRKARKGFIQKLDTDFPTSCAALFIKDVLILESLYEFAVNTGVFDVDTNILIEHINNFYKELKNIYNNNIKPNIKKAIIEEVDEFTNMEFNSLSTNELHKIYITNRGNYIEGSSDFHDLINDYNLYYYIEKMRASTILGDVQGLPIGEIVDIYSLYPFTVNISSNNIISGIKWSPPMEGT